MENFPSNSNESKPTEPEKEPKKFEKVVEGNVIRRKKTLTARFLDTFFGDDSRNAAQYVMSDVLIPAVRETIADAISQGVERMIFGEVRSTSRRTGRRPGDSGPYVSYNRYSSPSSTRPRSHRDEPRTMSRRERGSHDFGNIILATRAEAEEVIHRLVIALEQYESVSVADLYELLGMDSDYTDDNWGWTDLRRADVRRVPDGYRLVLPRTEPLG